MESNEFNPADSIKTIENALQQAKAENTGAAFYYRLWGTVLSVHYLLQFVAVHYPALNSSMLKTCIWLVFPIGGLLSYLRSKKDTKNEKVIPRYESLYLFAFGGFALAYGIMFVASAVRQPQLPVVLLPLLLGFTVFVTGGVTRHKASMVGGVIALICAGISVNMPLEIQYLLAMASSLISCLIPGYLMKHHNV